MESIEIPFGAKDSELKGWEYKIPEGFEAEIKDGKIIVKQAESEDDRIRKKLIEALKQLDREKSPLDTYPYQEWISYLEKQKETIVYLTAGLDRLHEKVDVLIQENNSLYVRLEQKPAEWSEEDEKMIDFAYGLCYDAHETAHSAQDANKATKCMSWLKSLRSRPKSSGNWKPSKKGITAVMK